MINRQNWMDVRAYIRYIEKVRQNDHQTVKRARAHLRHLLEWADDRPLPKARNIDPTYPTYLLTARADGQEKTLASSSIIRGLANARQFFSFACIEWPQRYRSISESWISLLTPPRHIRTNSQLSVHQFYPLEDVLKIAAVSTETLRQERGKVAVCLGFLSAARAEAMASLPISCVHIEEGKIEQFPEAGVRTKGRKAAVTYLLPIPELLEVCNRWDRLVRAALPANALWYATLTNDGMAVTPTIKAYEGRNNVIERDVHLICDLAGVDYRSPHQLRHGHVVYAIKHARNMAELKAISQNVMHASVITTDSKYGTLGSTYVNDIIGNLGKIRPAGQFNDKIQELIELLQGQ
jgi:integrase